MGDWVLRDGEWVHDPSAPTPITVSDYDPSATRVDLPVVTAGRVTYDEHVDYANPRDGGYVYTDPTRDDDWPRITEHDAEPPDVFPPGWSGGPTERDQAAIDAGNA